MEESNMIEQIYWRKFKGSEIIPATDSPSNNFQMSANASMITLPYFFKSDFPKGYTSGRINS